MLQRAFSLFLTLVIGLSMSLTLIAQATPKKHDCCCSETAPSASCCGKSCDATAGNPSPAPTPWMFASAFIFVPRALASEPVTLTVHYTSRTERPPSPPPKTA